MKKASQTGILLAILAAALYALNSPFSKILLDYMQPTLMAGFLYVGAGLGMGLIAIIRKLGKTDSVEARLTGAELPYTVAMIVLDVAAPIFLLLGLKNTTAANASRQYGAYLPFSPSDSSPTGSVFSFTSTLNGFSERHVPALTMPLPPLSGLCCRWQSFATFRLLPILLRSA